MNELENEMIADKEFDLICEYIKIRNNSKVSQRELSNITGLAQSTIARLEKNLHSASLGTFIRILNALDCKLIIENNSQEENNGTR